MPKSGWENTNQQLKTEAGKVKAQAFSPAEVKQMFDDAAKDIPESAICAVMFGHDGTTKSGVCMDCRSAEEIKAKKQVLILDLDGSAAPLKMKYFKGDPNIKIFDPFMLMPDGDIDYVATYNKILAIVRYIRTNEAELNLAAVVLDGLNTLLKICEYVMRYESLKVDPDAQIHDRWQWAMRNRRYLVPVILIKKLHCKRFFTTHLKELKNYSGSQLIHMGWVPDWEKSTPGIMFQRVMLERKDVQGNVTFMAHVEKAKGALQLEGKEYKVAEVTKASVKWYGLKDTLYAELEKQQ